MGFWFHSPVTPSDISRQSLDNNGQFSLIPWSEFQEEYGNLFSAERGAPALSFRVPLGALIIKEKLGTSDSEFESFIIFVVLLK